MDVSGYVHVDLRYNWTHVHVVDGQPLVLLELFRRELARQRERRGRRHSRGEDPVVLRHCPGQKPPKRAVKRPARPYKSAIQNRFAMENAKER